MSSSADCDQKKVGLLNFHFANNYGAVLVAFSLKKAVESLGYHAVVIDYVGQRFQDSAPFMRFRGRYLSPISKEYATLKSLTEDSDSWERVIVGSDQVWHMFDTRVYMLRWLSGRCSLISYAASFGHDRYDGSIPRSEAYQLLKRFDAVSVREDSGVSVCRDDFDVDAVQVLDPTFLLDASEYDRIIAGERVKLPKEPYACGVFLSPESKDYAKNINVLLDIRSKYPLVDAIRNDDGSMRSVAEWLALIKNARYVITDSFHGAAFSIIFNKQFVPLMHEGFNGNARIPSLLASFGIDHSRIALSVDAITLGSFHEPIDYDIVNARLGEQRAKAMTFLKDALVMEPGLKEPVTPVDAPHAFRCLGLSKAKDVSDEVWNYYRKWISLKLAESAGLSERLEALEGRIAALEKAGERPRHGRHYYYFKYKWYKLLGKVTFGSRRIHYNEKAFNYKKTIRNI